MVDNKNILIDIRKRYSFVMNIHAVLLIALSFLFISIIAISMLGIIDSLSFINNPVGISIILFFILTSIFANGYYLREMYLNINNIDEFYSNYGIKKLKK